MVLYRTVCKLIVEWKPSTQCVHVLLIAVLMLYRFVFLKALDRSDIILRVGRILCMKG